MVPGTWNDTLFGSSQAAAELDQVFDKDKAATMASIDGRSTALSISTQWRRLNRCCDLRGRRMRNGRDHIHPMQLHPHSFELTRIAGKRSSGVIKDVSCS